MQKNIVVDNNNNITASVDRLWSQCFRLSFKLCCYFKYYY